METESKTRYSFQREKILELLRSTHVHPTAEWIFKKLKEEIPHLSIGTVYRNLNILAQHGEIDEVVSTDLKRRFDGNTEFHYHFICDECKSVFDLEQIFPVDIFNQMQEQIPHLTRRCSVEFFGICQDCQEKMDF